MKEAAGDNLWTWLAAGLAFVGALLTILLPALPPGQDIPPNLSAVAVLADPTLFQDFYTVNAPATADVFEWLAGIFYRGLPLAGAARAALATNLFLFVAGVALLVRNRGGSVALGLALASAYSVGWCFAMGFVDFNMSLTPGIWALVLLSPRGFSSPGTLRRVGAALLLLLAARAHFIGAGLSLAALLTLRLSEPLRPQLAKILLKDLLTVSPALAWIIAWAGPALLTAVQARSDNATGFAPDGFRLITESLLSTTYGAFTPWGWALGVLLLGLAILSFFNRLSRQFGAGALAWLLLMALVPLQAGGWDFVRPRMGFIPLMLLPSLIPAGSFPRIRGAGAWGALLIILLGFPGALQEGQRAADAVESFGTQPSGATFEVVFAPEPLAPSGPYIRSGIGLAHYATLHGGAVAGAFASYPVIHPILFKGGMENALPASERLGIVVSRACMENAACYLSDEHQADRIAWSAIGWQSVALVGTPPAVIDRLIQRGYEPLAPALLAPRPASIDFRFPAGTRGEVTWQLAWPQTLGLLLQGEGRLSEDGAGIRLGPLPAGPATLLIRLRPESATPEQEALTTIGPLELLLQPGETLRIAPEPGA